MCRLRIRISLTRYLPRVEADTERRFIQLEPINGRVTINFMKTFPALGQCADMGVSSAVVTTRHFLDYFANKRETAKSRKLAETFMKQIRQISAQFSSLAKWIASLVQARAAAEQNALYRIFHQTHPSTEPLASSSSSSSAGVGANHTLLGKRHLSEAPRNARKNQNNSSSSSAGVQANNTLSGMRHLFEASRKARKNQNKSGSNRSEQELSFSSN